MNIGFLLIVSTIMWLIIDWAKPLWTAVPFAKYINMGVALVGAVALTLTFNLDLFVALELAAEPTIIGGVFAALTVTAGSGLINEIIKGVGGAKGVDTVNNR